MKKKTSANVESVPIGPIPLLSTTVTISSGQCTIQAEGYEQVTSNCFNLTEFNPLSLIIIHIHTD